MVHKLQSITIPSSVIELKNGWCDGISDLKRVEVEQGNLQYFSVDCKCITEKSEDNDTLIIWKRDVVEVIGQYAFNFSNLERITIQASVTRICEHAFAHYSQLVQVDFPPNSQIQIIEEKAFSFTDIERITIPASVTRIYKNAFDYCNYLVRVKFKPNSQLQTIEQKSVLLYKYRWNNNFSNRHKNLQTCFFVLQTTCSS